MKQIWCPMKGQAHGLPKNIKLPCTRADHLNVIHSGRLSGLYYKHITIVNDNSIMMLQAVVSPTIIILMTLKMSFMFLANIYSRGVTHDDRHVMIVIYL